MRMAALFFALVGLASAADRSAMRFPGSAVKYVVPVLDLDIRHDGSGPRMPHETRHGLYQPFPDVVDLKFHYDGQDVHIRQLKLIDNLYNTESIVETHFENGVVKRVPNIMNAYSDGKGAVAVLHESGTFEASFPHEGSMHYVEPAHLHERHLTEEHWEQLQYHAAHGVVAYNVDHVDFSDQFFGARAAAAGAHAHAHNAGPAARELFQYEDGTTNMETSSSPLPTKWDCVGDGVDRQVRMGFASDYGFTKKMGGGSVGNGNAARDAITMIIASSNDRIYERQVGFRLQVVETVIMTTTATSGSKSWNTDNGGTCMSIDQKLDYFAQYRGIVKPNVGGLWHLMTDCYPSGTVGLASMGVVCSQKLTGGCSSSDISSSGTGVSSRTFASTWTTVAHEVGHNFGGEHSFEEGQGRTGGIMDYADGLLNGRFQFNSKYRKNQICAELNEALGDKSKTSPYCNTFFVPVSECIEPSNAPPPAPTPAPFCGDGKVDDGEQCDGGNCCDAQCNWKQGVECTSGDCCDQSTCTYYLGTQSCTYSGRAGEGYCNKGVCERTLCDVYSGLTYVGCAGQASCSTQCMINGNCNNMAAYTDSSTGENLGDMIHMKSGTPCSGGTCNGSGKCVSSSTNAPTMAPAWVYGEWSGCSKTCGSGTRTRSATCKSGTTTVSNSLCSNKQTSEACNTQTCPTFSWEYTEWGTCTKPCDTGSQTRTRKCVRSYQGSTTVVADKTCLDLSISPDLTIRECNTSPCTRAWSKGDWGECSANCGGGTETRVVECKKTEGSVVTVVEDSECPACSDCAESRECNTNACPEYFWQVGTWSTCSKTCDGGTETRAVSCRDKVSNTAATDSQCSGAGAKPTSTQACNTATCPNYVWVSGAKTPASCPTKCGMLESTLSIAVTCVDMANGDVQVFDSYCTGTKPPTFETCPDTAVCPVYNWLSSVGDCSATECGLRGTRTVTVVCRNVADAANPFEVDDTNCDENAKPSTAPVACSGTCVDGDFVWKTGAWSSCSAQCGGGSMTRTVTCQDPQGNPSTSCKGTQPSTYAPCNAFGCPTWHQGDWSACNVACGEGTQNRTVTCRDHLNFVQDPAECTVAMPATEQPCSSGPCPHWHQGEWGACSKPCGGGTQSRTVKCRLPHDLADTSSRGLIVRLGDPSCDEALIGKQFPTEQQCNVEACPKYIWVDDGAWSACSQTCGAGTSTGNSACLDSVTNAKVDDALCTGDKPTSRPCNRGDCPTYSWHIGTWSECSTDCGSTGTQSRSVHCKATYTDNGKTVQDFVAPSFCAGLSTSQPESSGNCNRQATCGGNGQCVAGTCQCAAGTATVATLCDTPGSITNVELHSPSEVASGDKVVVTWMTQGDIGSVFIVLRKDTSAPVWISHLYNGLYAAFEVPVIAKGSYQLEVYFNSDIKASASTPLTVADPCDYVDCAGGTCTVGVCDYPVCYNNKCNPLQKLVGNDLVNVATCTSKNGNEVCECNADAGYTGATCHQPPAPCAQLDCQNGGIPKIEGSNNDCPTQCSCPLGYSGAKCETCASACRNGGQRDGSGCGDCMCAPGYSGNICQCQHAVVTVELNPTGYTSADTMQLAWRDLEAALGTRYMGTQVKVQSLNNNVLKFFVRGVCDNLNERVLEPVFADFTPEQLKNVKSNEVMRLVNLLQTQLSDIDSILLRGIVTQQIKPETFTYVPPPGFVDLCLGRDCGGKGTCDLASGTCFCNAGWSGANCGTVELCHFNDCNGHGTCDSGTGACTCAGGWSGVSCSIAPSSCSGRTCSGQGTCAGGFCVCTDGYTGVDCEISPDACFGKDCGQGFTPKQGVCLSGACICFDDWEGVDCSVKKDPCASKNCGVNSVGCTNGVCQCKASHTGALCDVPLPTCDDTVKNGDETGVDCGGSCPACPTCSDGIMNGLETGVDCGGLKCLPCVSCGDGKQNGDEEGVDCGGSKCAPCSAAPTCYDDTKNGDETGIDCGGSCPPECASWSVGPWSPCSKDCGGGVQTREFSCKKNGNTVDNQECAGLHAVSGSQSCNEQVCEVFEWTYGAWEDCSAQCGDGFQYRTASCKSNLIPAYDAKVCNERIGSPPEPTSKACNLGQCSSDFTYVTGVWSECTVLCGGGAQTRELQCQETATQVTVDMSECEGDEPITSRECNMEKCVEVEWVYCGWDACTAQCGGGANGGAGGGSMMGIRSRQAMCMTVEDTPRLVDETRCSNLKKEATVDLGCNERYCGPGEWNWMTTKWSNCVVDPTNPAARKGKRTRSYHCHSPDGGNAKMEDCEREIPEKTPIREEECFLDQCSVEPEMPTPAPPVVSPATKALVAGAMVLLLPALA